MKIYLAILSIYTLNIYANKADYDGLFDNIDHGNTPHNLKAHRTNYFLPMSHRMSDPYNDNSGLEHESSKTEAEFQIS